MMAKGRTVNMVQTFTTTQTTTSYTRIEFYFQYLKTPSGFLKLAQLICCIVAVTLLGICHSDTNRYYIGYSSQLFFFIVVVAFLILTFCMLISYICSLATYQALGHKSSFEFIFNTIAFLLFLISTIIYFVHLHEFYFSRSHDLMFSISGYCGGTLTVLYFINAIIVR